MRTNDERPDLRASCDEQDDPVDHEAGQYDPSISEELQAGD